MDEINKCEICCSQFLKYLFNVSDYRLGTTKDTFKLKQCQSCGHVMLLPKPDAGELNSYYPNTFYGSGRPGLLAKINYKIALNRISGSARKGRLLDIGCGAGAFLSAAADHGYEVYGQEISSEGTRIAIEKLGSKIFNKNLHDCKFASGYFDVITLWHVAEHVYDITVYLKEIYRILKPSGTLIIEVPNFNCVENILFKKYSLFIEAPRHLRHFTKNSLRKILQDTGFKCELNNGWSFFSFPLSMLSSGRHIIYTKFKSNKAAYIYKLVFLPLLLLSGLNSLFTIILQRKAIIGARCTKSV